MNKIIIFILALIITTTYGQLAKCRTTAFVGAGQHCSAAGKPLPELVNVTKGCIQSHYCDSGSAKCRTVPAFGSACTHDFNCTSDVFPLPTATLQCINNKCSYNKHVGLPCTNGLDCITGICTSGKCAGRTLGQSCSQTQGCVDFNTTQLFCHPTHGNCTAKGGLNDACSGLSCVSGLQCIGNKCVVELPALNSNCTITDANACKYNGLSLGLICYPDGKCRYPNAYGPGQPCAVGAHCNHLTGCKNNMCMAATNVTCLDASNSNHTQDPAKPCGSGICLCPAGNNNLGICAPTDVITKPTTCAVHLRTLGLCLIQKCPGDFRAISPWDTSNCGALCAPQAVAYLCCLEQNVPGFTKPPIVYQCPTARPSGQPTGKPTGKPTPGPTRQPTGQPTGAQSSRVSAALHKGLALVFVLLSFVVYNF